LTYRDKKAYNDFKLTLEGSMEPNKTILATDPDFDPNLIIVRGFEIRGTFSKESEDSVIHEALGEKHYEHPDTKSLLARISRLKKAGAFVGQVENMDSKIELLESDRFFNYSEKFKEIQIPEPKE
jgi:hypothetical protein